MRTNRWMLLFLLLLVFPRIAYPQDYTILKLPTLGGAATRAFGINDKGQITGVSDTTTLPHAFLWSKSGGLQDLQTLSAQESTGNAINKNGIVAGMVDLCDCGFKAFLWTPASGMKTVSATGAMASGINSRREIVGSLSSTGTSDPSSTGFLWTPSAGPARSECVGVPILFSEWGQRQHAGGWLCRAAGWHEPCVFLVASAGHDRLENSRRYQ